MKKSIMHRNPIGHWERVATTTLRWKVILKLFISTFAFAKNAHAYDDLRNSFLSLSLTESSIHLSCYTY